MLREGVTPESPVGCKLVSSHYSVGGLTRRILDHFYGETFINGHVEFYQLIRERLPENSLVLDLGAGPGEDADNPDKNIRVAGLVRIGLDVDPDIRWNHALDYKVLGLAEQLPFSSNSFDMVFCDGVMEHIEKPLQVAREVFRILKRRGYFLFRTNNLYHYVTLASRLTPHSLHLKLARRLRKTPRAHEAYETAYRFNSSAKIRQILQEAGYGDMELRFVEKEPSYLMFHWIPLLGGVLYERVVNRFRSLERGRAAIFGICQK